MKRQSNRGEEESSVEYWARECPGQFLYVITFGPPPRRRSRRKRPAPIVPSNPPMVIPQSAPAAPVAPAVSPVRVKERENA